MRKEGVQMILAKYVDESRKGRPRQDSSEILSSELCPVSKDSDVRPLDPGTSSIFAFFVHDTQTLRTDPPPKQACTFRLHAPLHAPTGRTMIHAAAESFGGFRCLSFVVGTSVEVSTRVAVCSFRVRHALTVEILAELHVVPCRHLINSRPDVPRIFGWFSRGYLHG